MTSHTGSSTDLRFGSIQTAQPDAILGLTEAFLADTNPDKMNLTLGVYKDHTGNTPILACVKEAERRIFEDEDSKHYLQMSGSSEYCDHIRELIFGSIVESSRTAILQTPGGTGALRVAAGFLGAQLSPITMWLPDPTWANHGQVFAAEGIPTETYRYLASDRTSLDFDAMLDDLTRRAAPGDAVLLHGCCHNPTGIDPTREQWVALARALASHRLLPVIDLAYQGFGAGLREDVVGLHEILGVNQEAIVCSSFSKNFGLYGERVGGMSLIAADDSAASASMSQLKRIVRCSYSNPPRHGSSIVSTVLGDQGLTSMWHDELAVMRARIDALRSGFVERMKTTGRGHDFSFLLSQNGMFSFTGLAPDEVDRLREKHGIYLVRSGRVNVAGIHEDRMEHLCTAVADVLEH